MGMTKKKLVGNIKFKDKNRNKLEVFLELREGHCGWSGANKRKPGTGELGELGRG